MLRLRHLPLDKLTRIAEPMSEPLTLEEVKAHLRVLHMSEDDYITGLIRTAREMAEEDTKRSLLQQGWRLLLDRVPSVWEDEWWDGVRDGAISQSEASAIELPRPPLQTVTHIKTYNDADVATVFAASNYFVETASDPGRIALRRSGVWPYADRQTSGFEIQFVAGYANAATVPSPIKHGMMLLIAELYRNREQSIVGTIVQGVPYGVSQLWRDYVVRQ